MFAKLKILKELIGLMNRAYDKDSRKLFRRIRKHLETELPFRGTFYVEQSELIDQIDLLLGDREDPFDMDAKP